MTTNITSISPEIEVIPLLPLPFGQSWYIKFNYCVTNHRLKHLFPLKEICQEYPGPATEGPTAQLCYGIKYSASTIYTIWYTI